MHKTYNLKVNPYANTAAAYSAKPLFDSSNWATAYSEGEYYDKAHPHIRVTILRINQITKEHGLYPTIEAIKWWYENEYEWAPPKTRWIWSDIGWIKYDWGANPAKIGAVQVGNKWKVLTQEDKPTGLPKTSVKTKTLKFVDIDRPADQITWAWVPWANKKYHWASIYPGYIPSKLYSGAKFAVIGRQKAPQMTPKTMIAFGVETLDQGPPFKALSQAVVKPGGDALQTAVAVARLYGTGMAKLALHEWKFDEVQSALSNMLNSVTKWDTDAECAYCHELPFDYIPLRCSHCHEIVCLDHYDLDVGACHDCVAEMPTCPCCEKKVHGLHIWCEYGEDCLLAQDLGSCETEVCDNCSHEVDWGSISYVCDVCYQAHKGDYSVGGGEGHRGYSKVPPWEERGITISVPDAKIFDHEHGDDSQYDQWKEVWGFDDSEHDPVQMAADFYLLHPIEHNSLAAEIPTDLRVLSEEAAGQRAHLIRVADDLFRRYCDMVCGGELRHHRAVGGRVINGRRPVAWAGWREVRNRIGPQALLDAAQLFNEFGGGSYGGPTWAQVCEVLHLRETNKISPEVFVDRVFNLEHNGGAIISGKVGWKGFAHQDQNAIKMHVGPAHAQHPARLDILAVFASRDALAIWADYVPILNRVRRAHGQHPIRRLPRPGTPDEYRTWANDIGLAFAYGTPIDEVRAARRGRVGFDANRMASHTLTDLKMTGKLRSYAL